MVFLSLQRMHRKLSHISHFLQLQLQIHQLTVEQQQLVQQIQIQSRHYLVQQGLNNPGKKIVRINFSFTCNTKMSLVFFYIISAMLINLGPTLLSYFWVYSTINDKIFGEKNLSRLLGHVAFY